MTSEVLIVKPESVLQRLGLPPEFGMALLVFCFALAVAPYLSNSDFGVLKIPEFSPVARKRLRLTGPLILAVVILLHLPFAGKPRPSAQNNQTRLDTAKATNVTTTTMTTNTGSTEPHHLDRESPRSGDRSNAAVPKLKAGDAVAVRVNLMIPHSMSTASVWVDGHEARVLARTAGIIVIEVPANSANRQIKLEAEGRPPCVTTVSLTKNTVLYPCA